LTISYTFIVENDEIKSINSKILPTAIMKKSYDDIIEAISYYASLGQQDELFAIISLLDRHAIPQPIVEQLKGDFLYLLNHCEESKQSYKKAAIMYQSNGETKKAEALFKTIEQIELKQNVISSSK